MTAPELRYSRAAIFGYFFVPGVAAATAVAAVAAARHNLVGKPVERRLRRIPVGA